MCSVVASKFRIIMSYTKTLKAQLFEEIESICNNYSLDLDSGKLKDIKVEIDYDINSWEVVIYDVKSKTLRLNGAKIEELLRKIDASENFDERAFEKLGKIILRLAAMKILLEEKFSWALERPEYSFLEKILTFHYLWSTVDEAEKKVLLEIVLDIEKLESLMRDIAFLAYSDLERYFNELQNIYTFLKLSSTHELYDRQAKIIYEKIKELDEKLLLAKFLVLLLSASEVFTENDYESYFVLYELEEYALISKLKEIIVSELTVAPRDIEEEFNQYLYHLQILLSEVEDIIYNFRSIKTELKEKLVVKTLVNIALFASQEMLYQDLRSMIQAYCSWALVSSWGKQLQTKEVLEKVSAYLSDRKKLEKELTDFISQELLALRMKKISNLIII